MSIHLEEKDEEINFISEDETHLKFHMSIHLEQKIKKLILFHKVKLT